MDVAGRSWWGHRGTYGGFNVVAMSDAAGGYTLAVLTNVMGEEGRSVPIWRALAQEIEPVAVRAADGAG